jgi:molybdenum cofactor cytidylyltransferase
MKMESDKHISAVILAAGRSSRMGTFKPLLPLGQGTMLERVIRIAREAGVADILVVIGHEADRLIPVLEKQGVRHVINPHYDHGMFSSLQAGMQGLDRSCRAFFLMPADMPLIRPETLKGLLGLFQEKEPDVCRPCYQNRRGHPPLISTTLIPVILAFEGRGGLRALLSCHEKSTLIVEVNDPGVLTDLDTPEDAKKYIRLSPPISR